MTCNVCNKTMNKKSIARHTKDQHPGHKLLQRRNSVSGMVGEYNSELKRKANQSLSPPGNEPQPRRECSDQPSGDTLSSRSEKSPQSN